MSAVTLEDCQNADAELCEATARVHEVEMHLWTASARRLRAYVAGDAETARAESENVVLLRAALQSAREGQRLADRVTNKAFSRFALSQSPRSDDPEAA